MLNKIKKFFKEIDKKDVFLNLLWLVIIIFCKPVRDFFIGLFKCIGVLYIGMFGLVLAMALFAIIAFLVIAIVEKMGVLPKGYLKSKMTKSDDDIIEGVK